MLAGGLADGEAAALTAGFVEADLVDDAVEAGVEAAVDPVDGAAAPHPASASAPNNSTGIDDLHVGLIAILPNLPRTERSRPLETAEK